MDKSSIYISIVIPVYNEENRITIFLLSVIDYLLEKDFLYEIVIVDDGSTDSTIRTIESLLDEKLAGKYNIIKLPGNLGKGEAIRRGMMEASGEYIFFIDADGSTPIREIDNFMHHFSLDYDVYIGNRVFRQKTPFKRLFFGTGYTILANYFLQLRIFDYTCGFKCYKRESAQKIFSRQTLNNWSFDTEDLFIAKKSGCKIIEIPVQWMHKPGSKVKVLQNIFVCAFDLIRIRYNYIKGLYS